LVSAAKHTIGSQTNKAGTIRYHQGTQKKNIFSTYWILNLEKHGYRVLKLLQYHSELNPIEKI
jgi:hypothetical protein